MKRGSLLVILCLIITVIVMNIPIIPIEKVVTYPVTETVTRTVTLLEGQDLNLSALRYWHGGPYQLRVGQTFLIKWIASRSVNVYIMNEEDWRKSFLATAKSYRIFRSGKSGAFSYSPGRNEPIYVLVTSPDPLPVEVYALEGTLLWGETVMMSKTLFEGRDLYIPAFGARYLSLIHI
mgnify:CR=1 FL=1